MANTYDVLKVESKRLRGLADEIDALAAKLQGEAVNQIKSDSPAAPEFPGIGQYSEMKQGEAILHALKNYGPQTTTELFNRLNAGGLSFKKVAYVTAILARYKGQWERAEDGKISLKQGA